MKIEIANLNLRILDTDINIIGNIFSNYDDGLYKVIANHPDSEIIKIDPFQFNAMNENDSQEALQLSSFAIDPENGYIDFHHHIIFITSNELVFLDLVNQLLSSDNQTTFYLSRNLAERAGMQQIIDRYLVDQVFIDVWIMGVNKQL